MNMHLLGGLPALLKARSGAFITKAIQARVLPLLTCFDYLAQKNGVGLHRNSLLFFFFFLLNRKEFFRRFWEDQDTDIYADCELGCESKHDSCGLGWMYRL